jgi:hypothetical protein
LTSLTGAARVICSSAAKPLSLRLLASAGGDGYFVSRDYRKFECSPQSLFIALFHTNKQCELMCNAMVKFAGAWFHTVTISIYLDFLPCEHDNLIRWYGSVFLRRRSCLRPGVSSDLAN